LLSPHLKSPKLEWTGSRKSVSSIPDEAKVEFLEKRVQELEEALVQADNEMAEVVSKMNMAQIEVLELQCERDDAMRQTRRLQADIAAERVKYLESMQ
jgi:chromosome segregation ATPase